MTPPESDRARLRLTFDRASDVYQRARPDYPPALFERLLEVTQLGAGARALEVGCATGKATLPLARRGLRITCVEIGSELAAAARRNLAAYDTVEVIDGAFEDHVAAEPFDLVFAATAWRWVEPAVRYHRAAAALRPRGWLAFWDEAHVFPDGGDPFFAEIQSVYDEIGEGLPEGARWPRPGELEERRDEIEESGVFEVVDVSHFDWETTYDANGYIDLLSTFSGHIAMEEAKRERLYAEIRRRLAERGDGLLRRHWGAVLHIARLRH